MTATDISGLKSVLLLGANNILALPVIRAIGTEMPEVSIHTLSYRNSQAIPGLSRYVHSRHFLEQSEGRDELLRILLHKIKETDADILLPIDEKDVRDLAEIKDELKNSIHLPPLPSPDLFDSLVHKNRLVNLLKKHDFPYPTTLNVDDTDIPNLAPSFFPCLIKPIRGSSGTGIKKVEDPYQLEALMEHRTGTDYILQEIIPGRKFICNLIAEKGKIHAYNIQEGLESRDYSFSTTIKFVRNDLISDTTHRLIKKTGYSGLANIDFLLDDRDGQAKMVDFNPRFWSSLSGSKAAGIDFARLACLAALGAPLNPTGEWPTHYGNIYHMGRSTLKYLGGRLMHPFSDLDSRKASTDIKERITDPLPEIARMLH